MKHSPRAIRMFLCAAALSACLVISAAALPYGEGTTTVNLRLRESASTSSSILATVPSGSKVSVLEAAKDGWYKVEWKNKQGYMSAQYLTVRVNETNLGTGTLDTNGKPLNLRSGPGTSYKKLTSIPASATLTIISEENGWYKTTYNGLTGYVSSSYVKLSGTSADSPTTPEQDPNTKLATQIVAYAKQFLGTPYKYGANGPDAYDCSAFTSTVYKNFGYKLNRSAAGQYNNGTVIDESKVQPGDLLLWRSHNSSSLATHVGIYIGDGQYIYASSADGCITTSNMSSDSSSRYLVGVRRIIN